MNEELEREFSRTTKLLLGEPLGKLDDYAGWLGGHVPLPYQTKSALSGKEVWLPPPTDYMGKRFDTANIISMDEMDRVNKSRYEPSDITAVPIRDLVKKFVKPISYACGNFRYQDHENVEKCSGAGGGRNLFHCEDVYLGVKNVAYSMFAIKCDNTFGSHEIMHSQFVIHAYNSSHITRCFEVDGCMNSSDLFFCHNCEGMTDSMFCFNAKNLRYAIGNTPQTPEKYREIKSMILKQLVAELISTKSLRWDIYNVGCAGKGTKLWYPKLMKG